MALSVRSTANQRAAQNNYRALGCQDLYFLNFASCTNLNFSTLPTLNNPKSPTLSNFGIWFFVKTCEDQFELETQNPTRYVSHEKVYKECNNEAFYYRGAPAALIVGSLTTFAAMSEKIKPGRFGYIPKILALSGVAFIFGKLSYGEQCTQKFLQMESTKYGNQARIIREARGMPELLDPNITGYFQ